MDSEKLYCVVLLLLFWFFSLISEQGWWFFFDNPLALGQDVFIIETMLTILA